MVGKPTKSYENAFTKVFTIFNKNILKMVAKEELEVMAETTANSPDSVKAPRNYGQNTSAIRNIGKDQLERERMKSITVQPITKPIRNYSKGRRKSNANGGKKSARPTAKSPRKNVTRTRRLSSSKSPNKKLATNQRETGSKVFMEPPVRATNQLLNSQSTRRTRAISIPSSSSFITTSVSTQKTLTKTTRASHTKTSDVMPSLIASHTKTSDVMPSLIAPAPTRSSGSQITPRLSRTRVKIASVHPSSGGSTTTSQGLRAPYVTRAATVTSSTKASKPETVTSVKTLGPKKSKHSGRARQSVTSRTGDSGIWKPRVAKGTLRPRTPKKVTAIPLMAAEMTPSSTELIAQAIKAEKSPPADGKKGDRKKGKGKKEPSTPSTAASDTRKSEATSKGSKKSKASKASKRSKGSKSSGKGKKGKKGKEKVKKLNRKAIYKDLKIFEKKMEEEAKNRKKMEWEKHKLFFYWNCVVTRLLDLQRRNHGLKKKEASLKMEKKDGMFHQNWKTMNLARLQREECLDQKRAEFRSMIRELRDSHKHQTDWLFKDIQTYVKDTYLVGQKYVNDVVGIRMEYTKGLTETMFEARENLRVLELEQNTKYGPALEEFEEQMRKLRSKIPTERQERLQKMLVESNGMLVELVNVYTTILHHNFIEVCHTANIINELKSVERRLEREMSDMVKKRDKIKERTEYLHDRVSNLRRQVNAGKEARKKLHRVMKEQEALQSKIDLAYIGKEITYQENSRLTTALHEMSERVDKWYFKVKRDFMKDIILEAAKHEERATQVKNYNHLIQYLFNVESDFLMTIENFKDHEEFDDPQEGLKVLLGVYRPHTIYDLEREFEGCTESFTTAIIFFKRRLQQHYMSLDDLHFFIKRRSPLSYLNRVRREELELKQLMTLVLGSVYGRMRPQQGSSNLKVPSSNSFRLL